MMVIKNTWCFKLTCPGPSHKWYCEALFILYRSTDNLPGPVGGECNGSPGGEAKFGTVVEFCCMRTPWIFLMWELSESLNWVLNWQPLIKHWKRLFPEINHNIYGIYFGEKVNLWRSYLARIFDSVKGNVKVCKSVKFSPEN